MTPELREELIDVLQFHPGILGKFDAEELIESLKVHGFLIVEDVSA